MTNQTSLSGQDGGGVEQGAALLELAARCEAGTGPDRELDCRIWWVLDGLSISFEDTVAIVADLHAWLAPYYTASLDAAMALVPEGHTIQMSDWDAEILRERGPWQAIVLPFRARGSLTDYTFTNRCDHAATAPLALCAAALRAITQATPTTEKANG